MAPLEAITMTEVVGEIGPQLHYDVQDDLGGPMTDQQLQMFLEPIEPHAMEGIQADDTLQADMTAPVEQPTLPPIDDQAVVGAPDVQPTIDDQTLTAPAPEVVQEGEALGPGETAQDAPTTTDDLSLLAAYKDQHTTPTAQRHEADLDMVPPPLHRPDAPPQQSPGVTINLDNIEIQAPPKPARKKRVRLQLEPYDNVEATRSPKRQRRPKHLIVDDVCKISHAEMKARIESGQAKRETCQDIHIVPVGIPTLQDLLTQPAHRRDLRDTAVGAMFRRCCITEPQQDDINSSVETENSTPVAEQSVQERRLGEQQSVSGDTGDRSAIGKSLVGEASFHSRPPTLQASFIKHPGVLDSIVGAQLEPLAEAPASQTRHGETSNVPLEFEEQVERMMTVEMPVSPTAAKQQDLTAAEGAPLQKSPTGDQQPPVEQDQPGVELQPPVDPLAVDMQDDVPPQHAAHDQLPPHRTQALFFQTHMTEEEEHLYQLICEAWQLSADGELYCTFKDICPTSQTRVTAAWSFQMILELGKKSIIKLQQNSVFGDIIITKGPEAPEDEQVATMTTA